MTKLLLHKLCPPKNGWKSTSALIGEMKLGPQADLMNALFPVFLARFLKV